IATRHSLHFTVRAEPNTAQGSGRDQFFFTNSLSTSFTKIQNTTPVQSLLLSQSSAHINGENGTVYSPWSEVSYFLRPSQQAAGSTPLYALYRRRRVVVDIKQSMLDSGMW